MKDDVATDLLRRLRKLPLGTTDRSATAQNRELTLEEVRGVLTLHDEALGRIIYDAVHRRRDVQEAVDWRAAVDGWRAEVDAWRAEPPPVVETTNHVGAGWVFGGLAVGAVVAILHIVELAAIAVLFAGGRP